MASTDKLSNSKGQAWFCATGLPSDIVIEVDDMTFHLHKFPLMSKSKYLHQVMTERETTKPSEDETETETETEEVCSPISLPDFPGGSETFEMAAKFCYGVKIDLTSSTVAPLRCASEVLEMTEQYSQDNLISKTERFFSLSVFKSLKDSVKALKSCERVMQLAETLGIVERCIDAVVARASIADPALFGWPVADGGGTNDLSNGASNQALWNGIETALRQNRSAGAATTRRSGTRTVDGNADSWIEEVSHLSLELFVRLISSMKSRDMNPEIIQSCLMHYAKKHIPGISRSTRKTASSSSSLRATEDEQRQLLETIISNLPAQSSSTRSATSASYTRFLFGLLRTAIILNAPEHQRSVVEKRIGSQLEQATLDDLLIPSYSYLNETLYDVDCVERMLQFFLDGIRERRSTNDDRIEEEEQAEQGEEERNYVDQNVRSTPALMLVGKLIDGYLAEIASDANLKPDRFYNLAVSLPEQARLYDDGLYRAVDVYLKAHPWTTEAEREKICGVMDCQKLTLEACTHAAQNERLPLRAVVQVLFFEQLQLRHAIAGTLMAAEAAQVETGRPSEVEVVEEEVPAVEGGGGVSTWRATVRENQVLQLDMDSMRTRVHQLERECSNMKKAIEKIDKEGTQAPRNLSQGWKDSIAKKFGCKFKTQVCDSQERNVVNARKTRNHHHQE